MINQKNKHWSFVKINLCALNCVGTFVITSKGKILNKLFFLVKTQAAKDTQSHFVKTGNFTTHF